VFSESLAQTLVAGKAGADDFRLVGGRAIHEGCDRRPMAGQENGSELREPAASTDTNRCRNWASNRRRFATRIRLFLSSRKFPSCSQGCKIDAEMFL